MDMVQLVFTLASKLGRPYAVRRTMTRGEAWQR
jgi:hypothetical protein